MSSRGVVKVGHRGAAGHEPENTLASVEMGIVLGADYVEVDVQRTRNGHLVLMHDKFIDRTTNGKGRVVDLSLQELRTFDAGRGQQIPLLREVLDLANHRAGLILESITPGITLEVFDEVSKSGFDGNVIFASFHHLDLARLREFKPQVETMALIEAVPVKGADFAIDAKASFAGVSLDSMTREFGQALHQAGLQVFVYTADSPEQIDFAQALGADGIISNYPERI